MIGQTIGNFEVVSRLGTGGMGEVWLAEQRSVGTRVAIKLMNAAVSQNTQHVQRFFNEARAVSRIQHVGIVKIFDVGEHAGHAYLIMEHLDGETLARRLARVGRLSFAQIADIGRQIVSVLDATHSVGIIHRDLKPDNVFLIPDRELGERVKILDFGIAKVSGTLADVSPQTMGTLGTPAYMAPEQWGDSSKVDWRADLYSLGCLVFEMTCGRPPFLAENVAEACGKHLNEEPPPASSLTPTVPAKLEQLLAQLLAKDPAARPSSMGEVARVFELVEKQLMGEGPTLPVRAVTLPTPKLERPKRSLSMSVISVAVVLLVLGSVVAIYVIRDDKPDAQPGQAGVGVVTPRAERIAVPAHRSPSPEITPPTSTVEPPNTRPAGLPDASTSALRTGTSIATRPASTPTVPRSATPPASSPVTHPAKVAAVSPKPVAAQPDKAATTPSPPGSVNVQTASADSVDAGISGSNRADARPLPSSTPERSESTAGSTPQNDRGPDAEALQQAVRARSAQTSRCYEVALLEDSSLSGTVTLRVKIDTNGRVIEADADGLTEKLQACLITQVREIKFPKPPTVVSITIPFRFEHE